VRQQSQRFESSIISSSLCNANRSQLLGFLLGLSLGTLGELRLGLETHDTASPLSDKFRIVVVLLIGQVLKELELTFVLLVDTSKAYNGSSLHVHKSTKTCLILDNHERNLHLTAQSRHPHDEFQRVNIVGNQDKRRLLVLDKSGNVLESVLDLERNLGSSLFSFSSSSGGLLDTLLLGSRGFRAVLVKQSKDSHGFILAKGLGKLVNRRRDLEALVQDSSLTLNANITRPLYETTQITTSGANVTSNGKGTGSAGKQRVRSLYDLGLGLVLLGLGLGLFLCGSLDE
jgi:hypothetical protein